MQKQQNNKLQKLIERYNNSIYLFIQSISGDNNRLAQFINRYSYARLICLHQPVDMLLLMMPILWTLAVACSNVFQFLLFSLILTIGAITVRGIGNIVNDIVDISLGKGNAIENDRPIANGELSIIQAVKFLVLLFGIAITILLFLPINAICFGVLTIGLTIVYPFMKRWSYFSQIPLEFILNLGVFIAWFTVHKYFSFTPLLIYFAATFWAMGYDTIYRHQNKKDDVKIAIKPLAIISGNETKNAIKYLYRISIFLLGIAGLNANLNLMFFPFLGLVLYKLNEQIDVLKLDSPKDRQNNLKNNSHYALLILLSLIIGKG